MGKKKTIQAMTDIRGYIKKEKECNNICIISCQNYANLVMLLALIGIRKGLRLFFAERNDPISLTQFGSGKKDRVILFLMKKLYRYADGIVANARELAEDLCAIVHVPVEYIYNPTVSENFSKMALEEVSEAWFFDNIPIILSVGRLERQKDYVTLLKAFLLVRKQRCCHLIILGEGSDRKELQTYIHEWGLDEDVKLPGFESNPYKYMARANVFVFSSIYEGLCNALIEAMALKIPCVSTEHKSGSREILNNGDYGELVPVGDYEKMASAMNWILDNPAQAQQKAEMGYNSLNRFSLETCGEKYLQLIEGKR